MTIQIGVMGSMADLHISKIQRKVAEDLGAEIAKKRCILVYGYEGDNDSLSFIAAKNAERNSGQTLAFLWGKKGVNLKGLKSIRIETGQERGGGREFPLILSCDAIICVGGGSGTLTEIAMAYQANIPIVIIKGSGGWSDKVAGTFLDERKRIKTLSASSAERAVEIALKEIFNQSKSTKIPKT